MLGKRTVFGLAFASAGLVLTGATGCERNRVSEYVAGFSTQVQVPREFKTLEVSVWAAENVTAGAALVECFHVDVVNGRARLPKTLGVNRETDNPNMMVSVLGFTDDRETVFRERPDCSVSPYEKSLKVQPRVLRRSRQNYRDGRILYLPMPLKYACFDVDCACRATSKDGKPVPAPYGKDPNDSSKYDARTDEVCEDANGFQTNVTCVAGRCVNANRNERVFRDFTPDLAEGESSQCFSVSRCMADAVQPKVEDAATCTYSVPGTLDGMNVRIIYDGFITEVLEEDKLPPDFDTLSNEDQTKVRADVDEHAEGFTVLAPGKFKLAKGLCDLVKPLKPGEKRHHILSITASRSCPSKQVAQPVCDEGVDVLVPAPSKLVVLLDRSEVMGALLEKQGGVDQVLGLSLDDPVFSTTEVAFKWLPPGTNECVAPSEFSDPNKLDVKFMPALQARDAIVDKLKAEQPTFATPNVRPTHASMEAVLSMQGAYALLDTLQDKDKLNRRAVVLLTNNYLNRDCNDTPFPASDPVQGAARDARNKGIDTYVIQLAQRNATDNDKNDRAAACTALSVAAYEKGDNCFDASDGNAEKAGIATGSALGTIVRDLSSCLYERPSTLTDETTSKVAFALGPAVRDVKFDSACNDTPAGQAVDGWNFDRNKTLVRLCGKACTDLREALRLANAPLLVDPTSQPDPVFVTATVKTK